MSIDENPNPTDPPLTEEDVVIEIGWFELWDAHRDAPDVDDA